MSETRVDQPTPCGLLVMDKQPGFTSMDVCAILRARLRRGGAPKRVKVGHGGTLDPMATGVLVVMIGKATRLCNQIMGDEKEYRATIDLAHRSTTDDAEGGLTRVDCARVPTVDEMHQAASRFVGTIQQRPPAFSALHVGGQRAYDLARKGEQVELPARPVAVHEFAIEHIEFPLVEARIRCGKGTYVRSLARDLGEALGTGGMLRALRRTRVGAFRIEHARTLDELPDVLTQTSLLPLPAISSDIATLEEDHGER